MMMMKDKRVHAVWSWWLIDGHRNLSCLEDIQTWDQSWFLSRPSQNIFFLAAATHRLPSLVPQPTCSWKWHPDTCRLGNPTTFTLSSWKGSEGIKITRKIYLISTSEIKARKEYFDQEAYPVPSIFSLSAQVLFKWKAHHKTPYRRAFAWESDLYLELSWSHPLWNALNFSDIRRFLLEKKAGMATLCVEMIRLLTSDQPTIVGQAGHNPYHGKWLWLEWRISTTRGKKIIF